jgi:hypothetical protein
VSNAPGLQVGRDLAQPVAEARQEVKSSGEAIAPGLPQNLTWFVWQGETLLDRPDTLAELPAGTRRLWVSFGAERLQQLASGADRPAFERFVAAAHARGMSVQLLLGEPSFVLPTGRARLTTTLALLHGLPLDGVVLDLERSQLKPAVTAERWRDGLLATIGAVHPEVPRGLTLVTHPRDLAEPVFVKALGASGVHEIVPMIYGTGEDRTVAMTESLLNTSAEIDVTLAQSIEPGLGAAPASAQPGRAEALARWQRLTDRLKTHPNFLGVAVQSLEDFTKTSP